METDVLIVGSGPTGLSLACQLIRYGVDFTIIDTKESITPYSKAMGVQARTLEIYDQIGLASKLIDKGWKADKVRLLAGGAVRGEVDLTNIGTDLTPFPFLVIVEQGLHEEILYDFIRDNSGSVRWETTLESFSHNAASVTAVIQKNGTPETVTAKYIVGCDGAHSPVRRGLDINFGGSTFERLFYVADVIIDWKFDHDALHLNLGENTLTAFIPLVGDRRWRIVGTFPEGHEKDEGEILYDEIERQVRGDTDLEFDITRANWFSVYKVHSRSVDRFSDGRCFLAGDSAHIHTPAGGQGMNTGIQDGYNLGWKLAAVLRHGADPKLLDSYSEERLPNAHQLLRTTDRLFDLATSDAPVTAFIRKYLFPSIANLVLSFDAIKKIAFPIVSQIGIDYRKSSLSQTNGDFSVKAGDRMPWFEIDGESIYDLLREPNFHLVLFLDGETNVPSLPADLMERLTGLIDSNVFDQNDVIAKAFGTTASFYVVLRPDNHIGLISDDFSPEMVARYLGKFIPN